MEGSFVIFVVCTLFMVVSLFRHDYRVALFLSSSMRVTVWPGLKLELYDVFVLDRRTYGPAVRARPALACQGLLLSSALLGHRAEAGCPVRKVVRWSKREMVVACIGVRVVELMRSD